MADQNDDNSTPPAQEPPPGDTNTGTVTMSQEDFDKKMKSRAIQADKAATKAANEALAEKLGMSAEKAAALIAKQQEADKAAMTEAERLQAEAAEAKAEADKMRTELAADRLALKTERALEQAGVPTTGVARATRMLDLAVDADDTAISEAIDALKADLPQLFTTPSGTPPLPSSNAGDNNPPPPGAGNSVDSEIERGRELHKKWKPTVRR